MNFLFYRKSFLSLLLISFFLYPQDQSKEKPQSFKVEVVLCDGRTLNGIIEIQAPEKFVIYHDVNGLEFAKELKIQDIDSINFIGWSPELTENKSNKGKVFKFYVTRFFIQLKDSLELKVQKKLPDFLEKFSFKNKMGNIVLYTYWMDLLKPDNTWYTGLNGPENGERIFCYKDVVKKITFKDKDKEKSKK
ncbi:MAG: hypothetical protein ACK4UJ_07560 [Leptonema sp. (in: bacteria)]